MIDSKLAAELDDARAIIRDCDALLELLPTRSEDEQREWQPVIIAARELAILFEIRFRHRAERPSRGGTVRGKAISQDAQALHRRIRKAAHDAVLAGDPLTHRQIAERFCVSTKTVSTALKPRAERRL